MVPVFPAQMRSLSWCLSRLLYLPLLPFLWSEHCSNDLGEPSDCSATCSSHQVPKEAFPPSPECWRVHPSRPNATPCLHLYKKPDLFTHWRTLYDQRKERESKKLFWKRRNLPRCALPISVFFTPSQAPPGKEGKNQDGLDQEWSKAGAREDPVILEGNSIKGITDSPLSISLSLVSLLRLCGRGGFVT